jgi:hypothetical protein
MGSNADGSLSTLDDIKNGIFGGLDPGSLLTSQEKDTSRPAYEQMLNKYNAYSAIRTGDILNSGSTGVQNGTNPDGTPKYVHWAPAGGATPAELLGADADFENGGLRNQLMQNPALAMQIYGAGNFAGGAVGRDLANRSGVNAALGTAGQVAGTVGSSGGAFGTSANTSIAANRAQVTNANRDLDVIRASAQGRGPSAAENLARAQLDNNIRAQSSMAASARGGNIASAMRGAQGAGSSMMLQSQAQIAAQRAQEQLNAQGLMNQGNAQIMNAQNNITSAYGALRGQDITRASAAAQAAGQVAGQYNDLTKTQGGLQMAGLGSIGQASNTYGNQTMGAQAAQQAARNSYAQHLTTLYSLQNGMPVNDMQYQVGQRQLDQVDQGANRSLVGGLVAGYMGG